MKKGLLLSTYCQLKDFMPAGRPKTTPQERIKKDLSLDDISILYSFGLTDEQVADFLNISHRTLMRWKANPEFLSYLKKGKEVADARVERSLYERATGYTFDSEKVFQYEGRIFRTETKEHIAPDPTSMIFWLKNRMRDKWRDVNRNEIEVNINIHEILKSGENRIDNYLGSTS